MHFSVQEALLFLLPLFSSALAADCFTVTGINTLALSKTGLSAEIDSTCADLRSGVPRTSRTSGDTLFSVRATSSAATYEFCESALENIATQCGGDVLGKFDFDFGGNVEHYEAQGHMDNPGQPCRVSTGLKLRREEAPPEDGDGESSGPAGDSCI